MASIPVSMLPIERQWLLSLGFEAVESDMGPNYDEHFQKGRLNVWEFNDTGVWLFSDADWIELKTRGDMLKLMELAGIPADPAGPRPT